MRSEALLLQSHLINRQEEEKDETKKDEKEGEDEDDEMPPYDAQTQNFIDGCLICNVICKYEQFKLPLRLPTNSNL